MAAKEFCPFDQECETKKGKEVVRKCKLYLPFTTTLANGEQRVDWNCALAWQPVLFVECLSLLRDRGVKTLGT